jgi:F420-dependent oxidoreductase-like protein
MDLRIFTEPQQGATYDDLLAVARTAEDTGFSAFFRSDHYLHMGDGDGRPGPTDAWITLAGLARDTSRIRLGTLVSSATFRHPGPLAVAVAQVDRMSGGRVELGLGTGWYESEHQAFGLPFPPVGERFDRFEEQLQILHGLWTSDGPFTFEGVHHALRDNPALARPLQEPLPMVIGGHGHRRTPQLAAEYATEFNVAFLSLADTAAQFVRAAEASKVTGRSLIMSAGQVLCVGRDDGELA